MDTQSVLPTRLCRSYEDFIQELRKESDFEVNVSARYGRHTQALLQASVWEDGKDDNEKSFESAYMRKNCYKLEAQSHHRKYNRDGEVKDLLLLGLFCFCLFVVNLACWSFFAGVPTGR